MCGIAGLVGFDDGLDARKERVRLMVRALERRGPDGCGFESWPEAVLGHRRLAIFDLSNAGRQPMLSPDGALGVVFNGAVYNWRALRSALEARGYSFKSQTDTEVLIHGYREWGIDGLVNRLRGMFAFGLWDNLGRKLFLVRDRLGVKPLLYSASDSCIAFASTARALKAAGFGQEIDEQAIAEYLEFGYVTDERSVYEGVKKVPAATILEWSDGCAHLRTYWTPPVIASSSNITFDEAVEETEKLFLSAVEKRLHADVPVGALLSGGVDSSLVCWAIARLGGDVTAFTVGTPGDPWDETEDAVATASALGIKHRVLNLSADDAPGVDELVAAYAEPFACASALGMLRVSRAVASSATVLLTGDGGDDVFLGYPEHRHLWMAEKLARALPGSAASALRGMEAGLPKVGLFKRAASFMSYATGGLGAVACAHDGLPSYRRHNLLGERMMERDVSQRSLQRSLESGRRVLEEFLEYDRRTRFVGEYMTKVDGATMHHALEARSPFLDQELWEFAARLPFEIRLRKSQLKAVLRELARRRVGERVARGRKRGFGIPVGRWIAGRWRSQVEEALQDSLLDREGWIRKDATLALLNQSAEKGEAPNQLWYIFVLESWLRREREETLSSSTEAERVEVPQHAF
ncbi:MAG: asparagine synthase (glutamine-hydrolyzing) [Pyrinomonadaceae bacterium]|nr:asparagine synthase (glutamine-hydrolyzing) [Pyrinomonadaceae bacterium]